MTDTKARILVEALNLFAESGYEAVTVEDIAKAVGIKAPSLYKHYKSKADIFDSLFSLMQNKYDEHSARRHFIEEDYPANLQTLINDVKEQFHFSLTDPFVSKARRLLTIEQYRLEGIKGIQSRRAFEDNLFYNKLLIKNLIKRGILINGDVTAMALEFWSPIELLLNECERHPEYEQEALKLVENHLKQLLDAYKA